MCCPSVPEILARCGGAYLVKTVGIGACLLSCSLLLFTAASLSATHETIFLRTVDAVSGQCAKYIKGCAIESENFQNFVTFEVHESIVTIKLMVDAYGIQSTQIFDAEARDALKKVIPSWIFVLLCGGLRYGAMALGTQVAISFLADCGVFILCPICPQRRRMIRNYVRPSLKFWILFAYGWGITALLVLVLIARTVLSRLKHIRDARLGGGFWLIFFALLAICPPDLHYLAKVRQRNALMRQKEIRLLDEDTSGGYCTFSGDDDFTDYQMMSDDHCEDDERDIRTP